MRTWKKRGPTVRTELEREESLRRAQEGSSITNDVIVIEGFKARGIPAEDIIPRVTCLSYNAWKALGRQVLAGEKGVKVATMFEKTDESTGRKTKVWGLASIFHRSQTLPQAEADALRAREARGHVTPMVAVSPSLAAVS